MMEVEESEVAVLSLFLCTSYGKDASTLERSEGWKVKEAQRGPQAPPQYTNGQKRRKGGRENWAREDSRTQNRFWPKSGRKSFECPTENQAQKIQPEN